MALDSLAELEDTSSWSSANLELRAKLRTNLFETLTLAADAGVGAQYAGVANVADRAGLTHNAAAAARRVHGDAAAKALAKASRGLSPKGASDNSLGGPKGSAVGSGRVA